MRRALVAMANRLSWQARPLENSFENRRKSGRKESATVGPQALDKLLPLVGYIGFLDHVLGSNYPAVPRPDCITLYPFLPYRTMRDRMAELSVLGPIC